MYHNTDNWKNLGGGYLISGGGFLKSKIWFQSPRERIKTGQLKTLHRIACFSVSHSNHFTRMDFLPNGIKISLRRLACISCHKWVLLHFTTSYSGALHHTTILFNREITLKANSVKFCLVTYIFLKLFLKVIL